jgi:hypothetical protein
MLDAECQSLDARGWTLLLAISRTVYWRESNWDNAFGFVNGFLEPSYQLGNGCLNGCESSCVTSNPIFATPRTLPAS